MIALVVRRRKFLTAALTALLIAFTLALPIPISFPSAQARTIQINARAFAYEPGIVQVQRGDQVTIELESEDAVHGLAIDGYDVELQAEPGKRAQATFVADREGSFRFRCSVTCGALHPFMIGELQVAPDLPLARAFIALAIAVGGALAFYWK